MEFQILLQPDNTVLLETEMTVGFLDDVSWRQSRVYGALFETILVSGEVRLAKPDPRIFAVFLQRSGRAANECLLIDDSEPNIVAAQAVGFQAIHFRSPAQLGQELDRLGLLSIGVNDSR
jgi:hypothetical protein